jgi:hypothetical protein
MGREATAAAAAPATADHEQTRAVGAPGMIAVGLSARSAIGPLGGTETQEEHRDAA